MNINAMLLSEDVLFGVDGNVDICVLSTLNQFAKMGFPFLILTNQTAHSLEYLVSFYHKFGFTKAKNEYFYTSLQAGIDWILTTYPDHLTAGYMGGKNMKEILRQSGFSLDMNQADWVFVAQNHHATSQDYAYLLRLLKQGATLIATDMSRCYKDRQSIEVGSGAVVKMLEYASKCQVVNTSFPSLFLFHQAIKRIQIFPKQCLMICKTVKEIQYCQKLGIKSAMITDRLDENQNIMFQEMKPDYFIKNFTSIISVL